MTYDEWCAMVIGSQPPHTHSHSSITPTTDVAHQSPSHHDCEEERDDRRSEYSASDCESDRECEEYGEC